MNLCTISDEQFSPADCRAALYHELQSTSSSAYPATPSGLPAASPYFAKNTTTTTNYNRPTEAPDLHLTAKARARLGRSSLHLNNHRYSTILAK